MADISGYTRIIKNEERGEHVRDAIVSALNAMNEIGGNASTLEGHPASYFAPTDLFNALEYQVGLVSDVLIAIESGLNALKFDMGPKTLYASGGTFTIDCSGVRGPDNLTTENFYFIINGASSASGVGSWQPTATYDPTTFTYTYTWGAMSADVTVEVWIIKPAKFGNNMAKSPLNVTENGVYDPGQWASYGPVTVNVPNSVAAVDLLATDNGRDYYPPDGKTFKKVTVNVPDVTKPKSITENGVYYASQEGVTGYSRVDVTIPMQIIGDHKDIRQNGLYKAKVEDNVDGYAEVYVDVTPSPKPIYLGSQWSKNVVAPIDISKGARIVFTDTANDWSSFASAVFVRDDSTNSIVLKLNGTTTGGIMIFVASRDQLIHGSTASDDTLIDELYADTSNYRIFGPHTYADEIMTLPIRGNGKFVYVTVASGASDITNTVRDDTLDGGCNIDISVM